MKLIELLRVIDDSAHKNEVFIGVRHGELDMSVGSAFGVLGNFCAANKLRTDVVENAEVLGIDTDLSRWSFSSFCLRKQGKEDDAARVAEIGVSEGNKQNFPF